MPSSMGLKARRTAHPQPARPRRPSLNVADRPAAENRADKRARRPIVPRPIPPRVPIRRRRTDPPMPRADLKDGPAPTTRCAVRHRDFSSARNYHQNFNASRRFHGPAYRPPQGYYARRWTWGMTLPGLFWAQQYWLTDYSAYDLPPPPFGAIWVRVGGDALLIDQMQRHDHRSGLWRFLLKRKHRHLSKLGRDLPPRVAKPLAGGDFSERLRERDSGGVITPLTPRHPML